MHKKLRMRFLVLSWIMLLLFLIALCAGISVYMYQSAADNTKEALRKAAETQQLDDETRGMAAIRMDENGKIKESEQLHLNLSDDTLETLAKEMELKGDSTIGELKQDGMHYRYIVVLQKGEAWAALAECTQEDALAKTLRRNSMIFSLIGAVLLLPVCILLTKWVSRPMETAWEKQNDFVSDATHELKTPLTVIAANTEAVMANPDATIETQEKWLGSIQGETSRMADLVGDLLFLAKIDAGEIRLDTEDIEISSLIEEMCMMRESDVFESGKMLEYEMTPDLHYTGDRLRIRQMVNAMLDNAEKYTAEGGTIRVIVNRDKKLRPRILISNTGTPISEADLTKIFDRFYRADPSRARETGGYGLGLCVAKCIAELHGGEITASSKDGINVFTTVLGDISEKRAKSDKKA